MLPDRHLGLVQAAEHPDLEGFLERAAAWAGAHIDSEKLRQLARASAFGKSGGDAPLPPLGQRIAVARDEAFAFTYPAVLEAWRGAGATLSFFSPLADEAPDPAADAVYLPGGYPELHAGKLAAGGHFLAGLGDAAARGAVVYGECGGYMVLGEALVDGAGIDHEMALLAFLGDGSTMTRGPDTEAVSAGIRWLVRQQDAKSGLLGAPQGHEFIYQHLVASLAVIEAFGLGCEELRQPAQAAVDHLQKHRNPGAGWRYQPGSGNSDSSVTSWAIVVLQAAHEFGLKIDYLALDDGERWLVEMTSPETARTGYTERGGFGAREAGDHSKRFPREANETITATALLARCFLGASTDDALLRSQAALVASKPPRWGDGRVDYYAWYHGAQALAQFPKSGKSWSKALRKALIGHQRDDGSFAGSWDSVSAWGHTGGRVYATAMAVLALEAPYRYGELASAAQIPSTPVFLAARRAWTKERFHMVKNALERIAEKGVSGEIGAAELRAAVPVRAMLELKLHRADARVKQLQASRDYLAARRELQQLQKMYRLLAPGLAAKDLLTSFLRDKAILNEIAASTALEKLQKRYDPGKSKQLDRLLAELEKLRSKYPGTLAFERAGALLKSL